MKVKNRVKWLKHMKRMAEKNDYEFISADKGVTKSTMEGYMTI